MMGRRAGILVATALAALLLASVSTAGGVNLWNEPQFDKGPSAASRDTESLGGLPEAPPPIDEGGFEDDAVEVELPAWVEALIQVLFTMVVVASVVGVSVLAWRARPRLRWRRKPRGTDDFDPLPDVAAAVVDEAAAQRAALLSGAPRNAIVRCWLRLEQDVAAAGLTRHLADTSVEFTERVLASYAVDSDAIHELAGLYREARFSDHPLDEPARLAALDALDRLHEALRDTVADGELTAGAST